MEDEEERDFENDFVVGRGFDSGNKVFNRVEDIASNYNSVVARRVPVQDEKNVALSWHDSDLNMVIDSKTFSSGCPLHSGGFCFLQGGVRATHGFATGRVCFEVKITSLCNIKHIEGHLNTHVLRVGWSPYSSSLALGSDDKSFGYDSNGTASNKGEMKSYGRTFNVGDVIGAYLELSPTIFTISFTVNGEDQGIAYTVPRFQIYALFPHVLSKNIAFECNFENKHSWFKKKKGFNFVNNTPPSQRVRGPRPAKNQGDCEVIMMIGLPRSGKTTWARECCSRNPGKYYIIDVSNLVDKMELVDPFRKEIFRRKTCVLGKLLKIAVTRCRNYILDQINATSSEWNWKLKLFKMYQREAVVCVVPDHVLEERIRKQPLDKGPNCLNLLKGKFQLPKPSFLLNRIKYVGMTESEAKTLFLKYIEEAKEQGFFPRKKAPEPMNLFEMVTLDQPLNGGTCLQETLGRGRNPESSTVQKTLERKNVSVKKTSRKELWGGGIAFVPGGIYNESSVKPLQSEVTTKTNFQDQVDHPRGRQLTPELEVNRRWPSQSKNIDLPPGQKPTQRASSPSPPRNIATGRQFLPEYGSRQDFPESTSQQNVRPLQREGQGGWRPPNRGIDRDLSPPRGVGGGRQVNEFAGRGMQVSPVFPPQMQGTKMLDCAGPREGRVELGFQMQNRPRSFSPNRSGSVQCDPKFVDLRPEGRVSGHLSSQNLRQRDCFPPTRERSMGEEIIEKDYAQRQRMADDFPPHGAKRDCGDGYQHMEGQIVGKFLPSESRVYDRSCALKRDGSVFNELEERRGRFPEVHKSKDDMERYREGRNEFPSHDGRQRDSFSPGRDQRMSRGEGREIPLNEQRMSVEGLPPCQGRGDTLPYHESRMEDKIIQNRVRTSNNDLLIHGERMIIESGGRRSDNMSSSAPELVPQEGRFYGDGHQHLTRNDGREHSISDPLARDSRGVGIISKHENRLGINSEWNTKFSFNEEERSQSEQLNHPVNLVHVGDNSVTSYYGVNDVLSNRFEGDGKNPQGMVKGDSCHSSGWQSSTDVHGDWNRLPPNISLVKEHPVHSRRDDSANQLGSTLRSHPSHEFSSAHQPHSGIGNHPPRWRSEWGSRSPEHGGISGPEDSPRVTPGPEHGGFPCSRSPGRDSRRSPFRGPRDLSVGSTRRSPDWGSRNSPSQSARRSPGPGGWGRNGSPNQFRRGSPDQFGRGSPSQLRRESPNHLQRLSLQREPSNEFEGESSSQFRDETQCQLGSGSPNQFRRGSPDQFRRGSLDQYGRGSPDHFSRGSPDQLRERSPDQLMRSPDPFMRSPDQFRSRSPDQFRSRSPDQIGRGPPDQFRRQFPERRRSPDPFRSGSPGQLRRGSPDHFRRGSPDHHRRGSPYHHRRGSPYHHRRGSPDHHRRGSPDHHRRRSPEQFRRGSPDQFIRGRPRGSSFRGSRGSRGGRRGYRESPNRDSRGPRGSPIHRSRSPISGPPSSSGRVRRGSPIHSSLRSPDRNLRSSPVRDMRGSPIPWKNSPSSMSRSRGKYHFTSHESTKRPYPRRAEWRSPRGRIGSKWHPGGGMKRFRGQEMFDPSLHLSHTNTRASFPLDDEVNSESLSSEELRDMNEYEFIKRKFMKDPERSPGTLSLNSEDDEVLELLIKDKPRFSGAARKRFKWLVQHGHTVNEARVLALEPIPNI